MISSRRIAIAVTSAERIIGVGSELSARVAENVTCPATTVVRETNPEENASEYSVVICDYVICVSLR